MRCFIKGFLGAVVGFFLISFGAAQFSDYRAAAEVSGWLLALAPLQDTITANAIKQGKFSITPTDFKKPELIKNNSMFFKISENGEIIVKGGTEGQMLILLPSFIDKKVAWECVGAQTGLCLFHVGNKLQLF